MASEVVPQQPNPLRPMIPVFRPLGLAGIVSCWGVSLGLAQPAGEKTENAANEEAVELSPFVVSTTSQGYYASQTLGGGRLRQDIKDLGSSIQVVTKDFLDDL